MQKISLNQKGFSLVQLMIGIGLTGFLVLIMSKLNEQGIKTQKTLEAKTDKQQWLQTIFLTQMKDSTACMNTFSQPDTSIVAAKQLTDLYRSDSVGGGVFFSIGDFLPSGDYQVRRMRSVGFQENAAGAIEGICPLEFEFEVVRGNTDAGSITASQLTTETVNFPCTINPTDDTIVNCATPQGVNLNSLWDLDYPTPPGTDDFASWDPQGGSGSVVLGRLSRDTVADDTASLNINLEGVDWSADTSIDLWEGLTLNTLNAFVWNDDWVVGLSGTTVMIGNSQIANFMTDTKLMFARGVAMGTEPLHVVAFNLPIEVGGDLYSDPNGITDGTDNYNYRVGLLADDEHVYVDWNRIWRDYSFAGTGTLSYNNPDAAEYGAFLRWDVIDARLDFYISGAEQNVGDLEDWHGYTIYSDRRFLFSNYGVLDAVPPVSPTLTWNYSYTEPGSRYSFVLGEQAISSGEHTMNIGFDNWIDCDYCFVLGRSNIIDGDPDDDDISDGADFSVLIGLDSVSDGYANFTHGARLTNNADYAFVGGNDSSAGPSADYGLAFGEDIDIINPYEVSFGAFNDTESTTTDFVRLSIGDGTDDLNRRNLLTYYNSGALRLSMHEAGYTQFADKPPGDLFVMAPNHTTARIDNAFLLGYNLWRRCDGTNPCDYVTFGDTAVTGYSAIAMEDVYGVTLIVDDTTSGGNTDRSEATIGDSTNLLSGTNFMHFSISGISTPGALYVDGDLTIQSTYELKCDNSIGPNNCWNDLSDRKLKKDIQPISEEGLLDKIKKIHTVSFRYISNTTRKYYGVIAQEIQKIFPRSVKKNKDGYFNIHINHLLSLTVKGMQILVDLMDDMKSKFNEIVESLNHFEDQTIDLENQNNELLKQYCHLSHTKREDLCQK
ncbi:tail fiber domain-containing protein [Bacteriovoracaceae bacterium]|nr:tail fiber domain-containing protein [Bacteriovoracaceae bacterium]